MHAVPLPPSFLFLTAAFLSACSDPDAFSRDDATTGPGSSLAGDHLADAEGSGSDSGGGSGEPADLELRDTGGSSSGGSGSDGLGVDGLSSPPGATITACVGAQGVLGYCQDDSLFLDCDAAFSAQCMTAGGILHEVPKTEEIVEVCDDDNDWVAKCTEDWIDSCAAAGGTFQCLDTGSDSKCSEGQCCWPGDC
jgi:hypothetical protein